MQSKKKRRQEKIVKDRRRDELIKFRRWLGIISWKIVRTVPMNELGEWEIPLD